MLETSTCNYDYFSFVLTLTGKSLEIRDYLKKIYIYNTRSEKNTVFDSLMVTTLKWNNVPRSPFHPFVGLEPVSTLSSGLTRKGHNTGAAYSSISLARDLYNKENSFTLLDPSTRLMTPRTLLALLTTS